MEKYGKNRFKINSLNAYRIFSTDFQLCSLFCQCQSIPHIPHIAERVQTPVWNSIKKTLLIKFIASLKIANLLK